MEGSLVIDLSSGNPEEAAFQSCTYTTASSVAPIAVIFTAALATVTSTRHEIGLIRLHQGHKTQASPLLLLPSPTTVPSRLQLSAIHQQILGSPVLQ